MEGFCQLSLTYGIDVAQHLIDGLRTVGHFRVGLGAYALTQGDDFIVLSYLFVQAFNVAALQFALQSGVEEECLALGTDAEAVGLDLALVVGTGVQASDVPCECRSYFIVGVETILSMLSAGLPYPPCRNRLICGRR